MKLCTLGKRSKIDLQNEYVAHVWMYSYSTWILRLLSENIPNASYNNSSNNMSRSRNRTIKSNQNKRTKKSAYVRCNSLQIPDDYSIYWSISRIFASSRKTPIKTRTSCKSIAHRPHQMYRSNKIGNQASRLAKVLRFVCSSFFHVCTVSIVNILHSSFKYTHAHPRTHAII